MSLYNRLLAHKCLLTLIRHAFILSHAAYKHDGRQIRSVGIDVLEDCERLAELLGDMDLAESVGPDGDADENVLRSVLGWDMFRFSQEIEEYGKVLVDYDMDVVRENTMMRRFFADALKRFSDYVRILVDRAEEELGGSDDELEVEPGEGDSC